MEALAAIGLSGNVVQFVQFAASLISTASEISDSVEGMSQRGLELEKIYNRLSAFSSGLCGEGSSGPGNNALLRNLAFGQHDLTQEVSLQSHIRSVEELAADCNALCVELLEIVRHLRLDGRRHGPFKSFVAALKSILSAKKIQALEERLDRFRSMILLHLFPFLSHQQSFLLQAVMSLRDESFKLHVDQGTKLDALTTGLYQLKSNLETPTTYQRDGTLQLDDSTAGYMLRSAEVVRLDSSDMEQLETDISNLVLVEKDLALIAKEQAFLRSLDFVSRSLRHDDIPAAHTETFQWMLEEVGDALQDSTPSHSLLSRWLRHGDGIFWLSGKAGSGKSTLMKWMVDHDNTQKLLEKWASPKKHAVAAHYFWTAGTKMQNSQKGLVQTLLYEIFCVSPELMAKAFPHRWSRTSLLNRENSKEWAMRELLDALQNIAQGREMQTKHCIFIDGVDEFEGDHLEVCQFLKDLSTSPNFKLCLSSRPWNVFEDAFGNDPTRKLYIQDLTHRDILLYSQSRLAQHPRWCKPNFADTQMQSIVNEITQRAQGVFLWVFLATKELRNGLVDGDTFRDLQRRLERLPTDLQQFFKRMMDQVDHHYHERMARVLRIAVNAKQPLNLQFYYMHEYEYEDEDYAINMPVDAHTPEGIEAMLAQCRRRINARCGGLLEIKGDRVEFLHRTVRDFVGTPEMDTDLRQKSGAGFMVNLSTLKGFIFLFRCWMQSTSWLPLADDQQFWSDGLEYANDAILESKEAAFVHLDAVEDFYVDLPANRDTDFLNVRPDYVFRCEILKSGLDRYVSEKLKESLSFFDNVFESPLCTVMNHPQWTTGHAKIVTYFLNSKHVNNEDLEPSWHLLVQRTCSSDGHEALKLAIENSLFSAFLKRGVKRNIRVRATPAEDESLPSDAAGIAGNDNGIRLPCAHVIGAIMLLEFRYSYEPRNDFTRQCLSTIDDFLNVDPPLVKPQLQELQGALQIHLKKLSQQTLGTGRLRLISQILQKVVQSGIDAGLEMDWLIPEIMSLFPGNKGASLVDLIRVGPCQSTSYKRRRLL